MTICPGIDGIDASDSLAFQAAFNAKIVRSRVPISGSIDLTDRCNFRCRHCYLDPENNNVSNPSDRLSTARIFDILDQITEAGCLYLLLTGGEPLLRRDFPEIYRHARTNGLVVTVFTNGILVDDSIIDLFRKYPPQAVEITLYGMTESTLEAVTGNGSHCSRIRDNAKRIAAAGLPLRLKTVLLTLNRDELEQMEIFANDLGVPFRFDAAIFPRLNGDPAPLQFRIDPAEAVRLELSDPERFVQWERFYNQQKSGSRDDHLYHCGAGVTTFHIDADGGVSPCLMARHYRHDLARHSFATIWNDLLPVFRNRSAGAIAGCNRCPAQPLCGFCPAFFHLENHREDCYSEYLCRMGYERYRYLCGTDLEKEGIHEANTIA